MPPALSTAGAACNACIAAGCAPPLAARRRFLVAAALAPAAAFAAAPRALWITRPQAQETVRAVYWADGRLQAEGYRALSHIYRDVHAGVQVPVALGLLDLNFALQAAVHRLAGPRPMVLFSGYRTAATNASVGGTEPSIHAAAQADDYIYEGLGLRDNLRLARYFQVGGLGLYPERGALHKDIGPRRSWITRG